MPGALIFPLPFPFSPGSSASTAAGAGREPQAPRPREPRPWGEGGTFGAAQVRNYSCKIPVSWAGGRARLRSLPAHSKENMAPSQRHFASETPTRPCPAREGPVTRRRGLEERGLRGCFDTYKVFHNLTFQILLSERQRAAATEKPEEPGPARGAAGRRGLMGWDGGAAERHGVTSPVSCLPRLGRFRFAPSRGIRCPWQAPRERLTLPAPRAKVAFAA